MALQTDKNEHTQQRAHLHKIGVERQRFFGVRESEPVILELEIAKRPCVRGMRQSQQGATLSLLE